MAYKNKEDQASAARKHYLENKSKCIERAKLSKIKYKKEVSEFLKEYLLRNPCVDCGEKDIIVLEFDHRKGVDKKFNIGESMKKGYSMKNIQLEIDKCDVRCANCHRRKTYNERGFKHRTI